MKWQVSGLYIQGFCVRNISGIFNLTCPQMWPRWPILGGGGGGEGVENKNYPLCRVVPILKSEFHLVQCFGCKVDKHKHTIKEADYSL